jgi:WD40 repeat protein
MGKHLIIVSLFLTMSMAGIARDNVTEKIETDQQFIYDLCFSKNGEVLAVADGPTIKFFTFRNRTLLKEFKGHQAQIMALDFSADSTLFASGDREGNIHLWDLLDGKIINSLSLPGEIITSLSIASGNAFLAAGTTGDKTILYNLRTQKTEKEFSREDDVMVVKFNHDGTLLASGGADKKIEIYNITDLSIKQTLTNHKNWIRALDFNDDGTRMISGDDDGNIMQWVIGGNGQLSHLRGGPTIRGWVTDLNYFADNKSYAIVSSGGNVVFKTPFTSQRKKMSILINGVHLWPNASSRIVAVIATHGKGVMIVDSKNIKSSK